MYSFVVIYMMYLLQNLLKGLQNLADIQYKEDQFSEELVFRGLIVQWSLINTDAINLDVSPHAQFFWRTKCLKSIIFDSIIRTLHLSGRFIYQDNFSGNQSVRINEAPLYTVQEEFSAVVYS
jgi:hypothetical protein